MDWMDMDLMDHIVTPNSNIDWNYSSIQTQRRWRVLILDTVKLQVLQAALLRMQW